MCGQMCGYARLLNTKYQQHHLRRSFSYFLGFWLAPAPRRLSIALSGNRQSLDAKLLTPPQVNVDNITGDWQIEQNWSIKNSVLVAPKNMRPRARYVCRSIFEEDFAKIYEDAKNTSTGVGDGPAQAPTRRVLSR